MNRNLTRGFAVFAIMFFTLAFSACGGGGGGGGGGGTNNPPAQFAISITVLDDGVNGEAYNDALTANNATGDVDFAVTSGALPTGLDLDEETGAITGTPTATGSFNFTITATDSATPPHTANRAFTVRIADPLVITSGDMPDGRTTDAYTHTMTATGGIDNLTWDISAGSLPAGLSIAASTGVISGTPTSAGNFTFTVRARDEASPQSSETQQHTIEIVEGVLITTTALQDGVNGTPYSRTVAVSGGTGGNSFSITSGALPANLSINLSTGVISGTPNVTGTFNFTVHVMDSSADSDDQALSIRIFDPLNITTTTLPRGHQNDNYSRTLAATGGSGTNNWLVTAGSLPNGLTLNPGTGVISGIPTTLGTFNFTVRDRDGANPFQEDTQALSIEVVANLTVGAAAFNDGVKGTAYSQSVTASGGTTPYDFQLTSGSLPNGLSLNNSTGEISGTPTVSGTSFSATVTVEDDDGDTASRPVNIRVFDPLAVNSGAPAAATDDTAYSAHTFTSTGGFGTKTWNVSVGSVPAGMSFSSGGVLSGTPTSPGTTNFTVRVTDSANPAQQATQAVTFVVNPRPLVLNPTSLPNPVKNVAYNQSVAGDGGVGSYSYAVTGGSLGGELVLNTGNGAITGTPTTTGTLNFTITVTDGASSTASRAYSVTVIEAPPPTITTASLSNGSRNISYTQLVEAQDGAGALSWSMTGTPNTNGLSIDESTGVIEGTPTNTGSFTLHVTVEDTALQSDTVNFPVTFGPGRNDHQTNATVIDSDGDDTISGSLSPYVDNEGTPLDADHDYYRLTANANAIVTIEVFAERAPVSIDFIDPVIQIINAGGDTLTSCSTAATGSTFSQQCVNDDKVGGNTLDSFLRFQASGGNTTFYLRIFDWGGRARPDMKYQIRVQGAN